MNPTNTTLSEKLQYLKESYTTLRTLGVIKTWTDFAELLDTNRSVLSSAKGGQERYLTDSLIEKVEGVMRHYPGTIRIDNSPNSPVINGDNNNVEIGHTQPARISPMSVQHYQMKFIPTVPIHAYRAVGFDVMEYFQSTQDDLHMSPIVQQFPGTDCYYFVNSDDMSPNLRTNDLLCLARLPEGAKVTNGDICILNTKYQGMLERFVYDDGDALILKSTQPRWTEMRIPKEEIFSVFRILGGIRTNI